jgi:hypothetical protein
MRLSWARARLWPGLWVLLCAAPATTARAYEDALTLGVGAGYAQAVSSTEPSHGALFDLTGSTGLSSAWSVRGRLSYAFYPDDPGLHAGWAGAELLYMVDIVALVPYVGAGLDGIGRARHGDLDFDAGAHLVAGLDYLVSRELALGLDARSHLLVTALKRDPLYFAFSLSATWIFER